MNNVSGLKDTISNAGSFITRYNYDKDNKPISVLYNRNVGSTLDYGSEKL